MGTVKKRILHVDLSTNEVTTSDFTAKGLLGLGGKALGVALLERHLDPRIDPLAPGNPVIFTSSPLAAYGFSGSNRLGAFTKSPLTGAFLESYSGGTMARTLCETEWDALVITGAAASPVRVDVDSAGAQIRAADNLWGQDVFTADDSIREDLERRSSTLVIGPAHGISPAWLQRKPLWSPAGPMTRVEERRSRSSRMLSSAVKTSWPHKLSAALICAPAASTSTRTGLAAAPVITRASHSVSHNVRAMVPPE